MLDAVDPCRMPEPALRGGPDSIRMAYPQLIGEESEKLIGFIMKTWRQRQ